MEFSAEQVVTAVPMVTIFKKSQPSMEGAQSLLRRALSPACQRLRRTTPEHPGHLGRRAAGLPGRGTGMIMQRVTFHHCPMLPHLNSARVLSVPAETNVSL